MVRRFAPATVAVLLVLTARASVLAQEDVPLRNWQTPVLWAPGAAPSDPANDDRFMKVSVVGTESSTASAPTPLPLVALPPCRLVDTRAASGFPSGYGPPSMPGVHAQRPFTIINVCGVPPEAQAVSLNFTVWAPVSRGDIRVFPAGAATPTVATLNWEAGIQALANAAIVPLGAGGAITVQVDGPGTIDLIVDVNGYFAPQNSFCMGADCRTSWNGQDANSVTPMPRTCPAGQIAVSTGDYQWKCGNICQATGSADCGGTSCANILTDPDHCGGCANVCSSNHMATRTCAGGSCNGTCLSGWGDCDFNKLTDGCETDITGDINNCGACAVVCPAHANASPVCAAGSCTFTCNLSFTKCGSLCTNTATDPNNCGACGHVCAAGHPCVSGVCQ